MTSNDVEKRGAWRYVTHPNIEAEDALFQVSPHQTDAQNTEDDDEAIADKLADLTIPTKYNRSDCRNT